MIAETIRTIKKNSKLISQMLLVLGLIVCVSLLFLSSGLKNSDANAYYLIESQTENVDGISNYVHRADYKNSRFYIDANQITENQLEELKENNSTIVIREYSDTFSLMHFAISLETLIVSLTVASILYSAYLKIFRRDVLDRKDFIKKSISVFVSLNLTSLISLGLFSLFSLVSFVLVSSLELIYIAIIITQLTILFKEISIEPFLLKHSYIVLLLTFVLFALPGSLVIPVVIVLLSTSAGNTLYKKISDK